MKHPLGNHQQQVVAHGNPNLCVDRIARCSVEGFDVLVADDTCALVDGTFSNHLVFHVVLCPCDKEGVLLMEQVVEPLEVNIALIHKIIRKGFYWQFIHYLAVMDLAFCQVNEGRYATSEAQQRMHFEGTLAMMELSPRTKLEAELDGAAVEGIDHIVYIQAIVVFVIKFSCFLDEILRQVVVDAPVLCLIQAGERRAWNKGKTRMVQLTLEGRKSCLIRAKALLGCELSEAHHHELVTAGELDLMSVAIVSCNTLAEDVLWEQRHDLGEYTLTLIHLICSLHYYQMQKYKIKSSKNFIAVNH